MEDVEVASSKSTKIQEKRLMDDKTPKKEKRKFIKNKRCCCISVWVISVVLALGLLFLILGLTVLKPKRPVIKIDSVVLSDLDVAFDLSRLRVLLNVSLDIGATVDNPNRVGFRYKNSTAYLRYKGNDVGEVPLYEGRIGARDKRALNLTLTLMADRLLTNSGLYSDAAAGTLPFQTYIRLDGEVKIVFNVHVVTYTTCDLEIDVSSRSISSQICHYKTKL